MASFPILRQKDVMDCGPTCLAMICKYYGKSYGVEYLRDLCFITNEGVSLYGISLAAESIGFHTIGTQITLKQLNEEMSLPSIIHWNQNHFVVLYKIKKTRSGVEYYIANPAGGLCIKYNEWEFSNSFLSTLNEQG